MLERHVVHFVALEHVVQVSEAEEERRYEYAVLVVEMGDEERKHAAAEHELLGERTDHIVAPEEQVGQIAAHVQSRLEQIAQMIQCTVVECFLCASLLLFAVGSLIAAQLVQIHVLTVSGRVAADHVLDDGTGEQYRGQYQCQNGRRQHIDVHSQADPFEERVATRCVVSLANETDEQEANDTGQNDADEASNDDARRIAIESVLIAPQVEAENVEGAHQKAGRQAPWRRQVLEAHIVEQHLRQHCAQCRVNQAL